MAKHPSDSTTQQEAEKHILCVLQDKLEVEFDATAKLPINFGIKLDAINLIEKIIVEVYSHIGELKSGQKKKIQSDILKLAFIGKKNGTDWRKIICFVSDEAAKYVQGESWTAEAAKEFGIEIHVVTLSEEWEEKIKAAQEHQHMKVSEVTNKHVT